MSSLYIVNYLKIYLPEVTMADFCKKCGKRLPEGCTDKYCAECSKKRKKTRKIIKYSLIAGVTAVGAVYIWESQPEYVRKLVEKSFTKRAEKVRGQVMAKAADLEKQGKELIAEAKDAKLLEEKGKRLLAKSRAMVKGLGDKTSSITFKF